MSQPPQQSAVDGWENSLEMLSSWSSFDSGQAESQRTNFFFLLRSRGVLLAERGGGNIQILKSLKKKRRQWRRKALCPCIDWFRFLGYFITGLHVYQARSASGVLRPAPAKRGLSHPEGSGRTEEGGLSRRRRERESILESKFSRGERW